MPLSIGLRRGSCDDGRAYGERCFAPVGDEATVAEASSGLRARAGLLLYLRLSFVSSCCASKPGSVMEPLYTAVPGWG